MNSRQQIVKEAKRLGYTHILTECGPVSLESWKMLEQGGSYNFQITDIGACHAVEDRSSEGENGLWLLIVDQESEVPAVEPKQTVVASQPVDEDEELFSRTDYELQQFYYKEPLFPPVLQKAVIAVLALSAVGATLFGRATLASFGAEYVSKAEKLFSMLI
jgi:hypothetical protein